MNLQKAQQKIQRILRDNLYQRSTLATSWSLNFNRLSKYKTSKKLFDRKTLTSWKKYNVTLLLDMSWSMGSCNGSKWHKTMIATQNILKLLKWVADIKVSLFNGYHFDNVDQDEILSLKNYSLIYKYIKDKMNKNIYIDDYDNVSITWSGERRSIAYLNNVESIDIEYEVKQLLWKDWEPILIILQDGDLSAPDIRGYKYLWKSVAKYLDEGFVKRLYKSLSSKIYMLSIGIWTNTPSDYFENFAYVEDASEIYNVVIKVFERLIK
jgi:hypothetical protein